MNAALASLLRDLAARARSKAEEAERQVDYIRRKGGPTRQHPWSVKAELYRAEEAYLEEVLRVVKGAPAEVGRQTDEGDVT